MPDCFIDSKFGRDLPGNVIKERTGSSRSIDSKFGRDLMLEISLRTKVGQTVR